jgi:hypothetical protein
LADLKKSQLKNIFLKPKCVGIPKLHMFILHICWGHLTLGTFYSWDILHLGSFEAWDVLYLGCFVFWMF